MISLIIQIFSEELEKMCTDFRLENIHMKTAKIKERLHGFIHARKGAQELFLKEKLQDFFRI